ncbi:MAG TPA: Ig-like domain-containing protein [Prosthecobacter sp.]|nr:Ig-like domain-containing protein [Prosthecobacter sp.]
MNARVLVAALAALPLFAAGVGNHAFTILTENSNPENYVSTPSVPVMSPEGVISGTNIMRARWNRRRPAWHSSDSRKSNYRGLEQWDSFPPLGSYPFIANYSAQYYANDGKDVVVAFESSGGVYKRVGTKWTTVAKAGDPIPDGVGNFDYLRQVAIRAGRVAFVGGKSNIFNPPSQAGVFIEGGNSGFETVINQSDDFGGPLPGSFPAAHGGRWWNGTKMAVGAYSGNWRAVLEVTPVPTPLTAKDDAVVIHTSTAATIIPVTANDRCEWGRTLRVTAVTQGEKGKVALAGGVVRYTPNASFDGSDSFTYTITDGLTSTTANVDVTNPFLELQGNFSQVLYDENDLAVGTLSAKMTLGGAVSGTLTVKGVKYTLKGTVNPDGTFIPEEIDVDLAVKPHLQPGGRNSAGGRCHLW